MRRSLYVSVRYTIASAGQNIGLIIAVVAIIVMELAAYKGFLCYKGPQVVTTVGEDSCS